MSVYDTIREGLQDDWQKARAYDEVRHLLEEVWRTKEKEIGYSLSQRIAMCLNQTPSTKQEQSSRDSVG